PDGFLVQFNANGVRQWATYYGGNYNDYGTACATDAGGNVYLGGYSSTTGGTAIATASAHQPADGATSSHDGFLAKFSPAGVRQWGTYYGGAGTEYANGCATDLSGNVYLTGFSDSGSGTAIATPGAAQPLPGGQQDAFLVKFNSAGIRQWGTY